MEKWIKIYSTDVLYNEETKACIRGMKDGKAVYIYKLNKKDGSWLQRTSVNIHTLRGGMQRGTYKFM